MLVKEYNGKWPGNGARSGCGRFWAEFFPWGNQAEKRRGASKTGQARPYTEFPAGWEAIAHTSSPLYELAEHFVRINGDEQALAARQHVAFLVKDLSHVDVAAAFYFFLA